CDCLNTRQTHRSGTPNRCYTSATTSRRVAGLTTFLTALPPKSLCPARGSLPTSSASDFRAPAFESSRLALVQPAVLFAPAVVRLLRDAQLAHRFLDRLTLAEQDFSLA